MGGTVSSGHDNDEIVDNLVDAGYLRTPVIEKALRVVDRGDYYLPQFRGLAYKDSAWKNGNLHISAPCIYAEVLECLELKPGLSFLNLGSGTGYFSTVAGLLLGCNGVNHGIELHVDAVEYARQRLIEFMGEKPGIDFMDFCAPLFVVGNCLKVDPSSLPVQYDRVYCGAAVPFEFENFIKNLVKVGGIVVMPCSDQLRKITRTDYNSWETQNVLPVSFASLIVPEDKDCSLAPLLPGNEPNSLRNLCRSTVRGILRSHLLQEYPKYEITCLTKDRHVDEGNGSANGGTNAAAGPMRNRRVRRIYVPAFHEQSDDEAHEDSDEEVSPAARRRFRQFFTIGTASLMRHPTAGVGVDNLRWFVGVGPGRNNNDAAGSATVSNNGGEHADAELSASAAATATAALEVPKSSASAHQARHDSGYVGSLSSSSYNPDHHMHELHTDDDDMSDDNRSDQQHPAKLDEEDEAEEDNDDHFDETMDMLSADMPVTDDEEEAETDNHHGGGGFRTFAYRDGNNAAPGFAPGLVSRAQMSGQSAEAAESKLVEAGEFAEQEKSEEGNSVSELGDSAMQDSLQEMETSSTSPQHTDSAPTEANVVYEFALGDAGEASARVPRIVVVDRTASQTQLDNKEINSSHHSGQQSGAQAEDLSRSTKKKSKEVKTTFPSKRRLPDSMSASDNDERSTRSASQATATWASSAGDVGSDAPMADDSNGKPSLDAESNRETRRKKAAKAVEDTLRFVPQEERATQFTKIKPRPEPRAAAASRKRSSEDNSEESDYEREEEEEEFDQKREIQRQKRMQQRQLIQEFCDLLKARIEELPLPVAVKGFLQYKQI